MNHQTPEPAPRPLCALFTPRLALLVLGKLDAAEVAEVRAHLAECDYCQWRLREYEMLRGALHRHFGVEQSVGQAQPAKARSSATRDRSPRRSAPPLLTLEDIMQAANQEDQATSTSTSPQPPRLPEPSQRKRMLTALGALAAVLVLAVLAASLFAYFGSRTPAAKPTPTLDPTTQAYLSVLRTSYVPWAQDFIQERSQCGLSFASLPAATQTQQLPACRPLLVPEIAAGKTLLAQLATAQPPTRWQAAHAALDQAMQATDVWDAQRLQAIDAQNVSEYVSLVGNNPLTMFCPPLSTFNVELESRNVALLPSPLPTCADQ